MNFENFELLDDKAIDNYIIKRDFSKVYHQQGVNLNDPDQNIEFIFGENNNYHQIGNAYLQFDITVRKADGTNFQVTNDNASNEVIRLVNNGLHNVSKKLV